MGQDDNPVTPDGSDVAWHGDSDVGEALQRVVDEENANIIADVVAHPAGAPSFEELQFSTGLDDDVLRRHVSELEDHGIVRVREFEKETRAGGGPSRFVELTSEARAVFDANGIFPEGPYQDLYRAVRKPQRIQELEDVPRPGRRSE